jgi:hypothetical protein
MAAGKPQVPDMVAGRTGKQIDSAKRAQTARLGQSGAHGKRKKCKKGKSCGASCIQSSKVCMVDLPWASSQGLGRLAKGIQNRKKDTGAKPGAAPKPPGGTPKPTGKTPKPTPKAPQQGPFKAPEIPKPTPKPAQKPKGLLEGIKGGLKKKIKRIIEKLREKGVPVERIKEEVAKLKAQGLL